MGGACARTQIAALACLAWFSGQASANEPAAGRPWTIQDSIAVRYFVSDPQSVFPQGRWSEAAEGTPVVPSPDGRFVFYVTFRGDLQDDTAVYELFVHRVQDVRKALQQSEARRAALPEPFGRIELRSPISDEFLAPAIHQARWESNDAIRFIGVDENGRHRIYRYVVPTGVLDALTDASYDVLAYPHTPSQVRSRSAIFATRRWESWRPLDTYPLAAIRSDELQQILTDQRPIVQLHARHKSGTTCLIGELKSQMYFPGEISPDERWAVIVYSPLNSVIPPHWFDYEVQPRDGYQFMLVDLQSCQAQPFFDAPGGTVAEMGRGRAQPFGAFWSADSSRVILFNTALPLNAEVEERRRTSYIVDYDLRSRKWNALQPMVTADGVRAESVSWMEEGTALLISNQSAQGNPAPGVVYAFDGAGWRRRSAPASSVTRHAARNVVSGLTFRIQESYNDPPTLVATDGERSAHLTPPDPSLVGVARAQARTVALPEPNGGTAEGILMLPPGERASPPPLVIQTSRSVGNVFRPDGNAAGVYAAQPLVARGIAVLQMNVFGDYRNRMTPAEMSEAVERIDHAVETLAEQGLIDPARVGLMGFSRPGYAVYHFMTNAHRTKVTAAVVFDSVTGSYGSYVESAAMGDPLQAYEKQYGEGTFWQNKAAWLAHAPSFNVDRVQAPMLFGATGRDCRWAPLETVGVFRYTGRPFDYFCLPTASHVLQRPKEREAAMQIATDWMSFWLTGNEDITAENGARLRHWQEIRTRWEREQAQQPGNLAAEPRGSVLRMPDIGAIQLAPDGSWFAYARNEGATTVEYVVRDLEGGGEQVFSAGNIRASAENLRASASGRWLAFRFAASGRDGPRIALVDLSSGDRTDHPGFTVVEFSRKGTREWAVLRTQPGADGLFDIHILELGAGKKSIVSDARAAALSPSGDVLAVADKEGTQLCELHSGKSRRIYAPPKDPPQELIWREAGDGLFFRTSHHATRSTGSQDDAVVDGVTVWHAGHEGLPGARAIAPPTRTVWHYLDLRRNRLTQLADSATLVVIPQKTGEYALAYDAQRFGWKNASRLSSSQLRDYWLIHLRTGKKKRVLSGLRVIDRGQLSIPPRLSPDGTILLYQDDRGDYIAYDIRDESARNLTSELPVRFFLPENDPRAGLPIRDDFGAYGPRLQGWSEDGEHVLISDFHDVWALPVRGGRAARNLTLNGRASGISYWRVDLTQRFGRDSLIGDAKVRLSEPLWFNAFNHQTGQRGLFRRVPEEAAPRNLGWHFANVQLYKAAASDVYVMSRTTSAEPVAFYRVRGDGSMGDPLTRLSPNALKNSGLPHEVRYLTYQNSSGATRHAALYLPVGYEKGQTYPTIVQIYTGFSFGIHTYRGPGDPIRSYLERGYAFLQPDIVPRWGRAGEAALEDVTAGVQAAIATGAVDGARLGLYGHSFGAYEVNFIITQTSLFKAAVSFAGVTNLVSHCGMTYSTGDPMLTLCENTQPFAGAPWWKDPEAYSRNSPLQHAASLSTPLLLIHGNQDPQVRFSQAEEFFNTLRHMGHKQVALLEYHGAGHNFYAGTREAADSKTRILQFYDHFLQGAPPPPWWGAP